MNPIKRFGPPDEYEHKLARVMERLGVAEYDWNWDRWGCWVRFRCNGELYQVDHNIEKARLRGCELGYGSDAFAQVVLSLEDLSRAVERGIYDLPTWAAGLRVLPAPAGVPACFKVLGFERLPDQIEDVRVRYQNLARQLLPANDGSDADLKGLMQAAEQAIHYMHDRIGGLGASMHPAPPAVGPS